PVQAPAPVAKHVPAPPKTHVVRRRTPAPRTPVVAVPETSPDVAVPQQPAPAPSVASANEPASPAHEEPSLANVVIGPPVDVTPPVALPPRLDLDYKVYFGSQGFMIGHATYRFDRDGGRTQRARRAVRAREGARRKPRHDYAARAQALRVRDRARQRGQARGGLLRLGRRQRALEGRRSRAARAAGVRSADDHVAAVLL